MEHYFIRSQRLAGYLMQKGFVLQGLKPDKDSNRNIFLFKNSDELLEKIQEYKTNKGDVTNGKNFK